MTSPFPFRHAFPALAAWLAALSLSAATLPPDAAEWTQHLEKARTAVAADPARCEAEWQHLARQHPVISDWLLQDLGPDAPKLLTPEAPNLTRRLAETTARALPPDPSAESLLNHYLTFATERRQQRLAATLASHSPIAFTEGHTIRMSFIGYTEGLSDARAERFFQPDARLTLLEFPANSTFGTTRKLLEDRHGMMRDVDASFDGRRLLFAWKKSDRLDDYHIHEYDPASGSVRQLTTGLGRADYEPIYLPDGDILFTSTRPEQSVPCWWSEISNLYRMDGDGRHVRRLAIDQVHALYPQLMADGRVTYTRWDYNDRGQNFPHPVFSMLPDGRDQRAFYGGNSWFPTSLLHTRGIPGSHKAMSIAAGHHTIQQGKLVILDTRAGRDEGAGMSFIAPHREVPYERVDAAMQAGDLFRYPYPFSEQEFLISFRPEGGSGRFGLYWMDADGRRELLHADPHLDTGRMVPLRPRHAITRHDDLVDYKKNTGTYYVKDVYQGVGLEGVPRGTAKKIRVVRIDYRAAGVGETHNGGEGGGSLNSAPVAVANGSWDVKEILGDVDIHADGSALFEVPAMQSIYLQVLDDRGRVIQTSRTWDTLRPGETKGCAGCHDKSNGNVHPYAPEDTMAWRHGVQQLQPFHDSPRGFSFQREIQPILDAKCVSCHDGTSPDRMDLRGIPVDGNNLNRRKWTRSYLELVEARREGSGNYRANPETGWVSWISKMSRPTELPPYFAGATKSKLLEMLDKGHHEVKLTAQEYETFSAWMDLLVPFSGDYYEGNAWDPAQMSYYRYYEGKRAVQSAEEAAEIRAYLQKNTGNPSGSGSDHAAPFTTARYRSVVSQHPLTASDGRHLPTALASPVMTDRLQLSARAVDGTGGTRVRVLHRNGGRELGSAHLPLNGSPAWISLNPPVRLDQLEFAADREAQLTLDQALGVEVREVPVIDGYHPFLDIAEK